MLTKKIATCFLMLLSIKIFAQNNFHYKPEHPKAGDVITFTYEPAGAIAGSQKPVEAAAYFLGREQNAEDIVLTRNGKAFTGTIKTDTSQNLVYFGFSSDKKFDNNFGDGYYILLTDGDKVKRESYTGLAQLYQYTGMAAGIERDDAKAIAALEKLFKLYPETRKENLLTYAALLRSTKKSDALPLIQKEIEALLKDSLKTEADYATLTGLYGNARLEEQANLIATLRKEKYPAGKWLRDEALQKFYMEHDPEKSGKIVAEIEAKTKTDSSWKDMKSNIENFKTQVIYRYAGKKNWDGLKKALAAIDIKDKGQLAFLYNNIAWQMQQSDSADMKYAEELSRFAIQNAKSEIKKPTGKKPGYLTQKQWAQQRNDTYTMFGDTYAMVLYRMKDYKNAYKYAKEAAITLGGGKEVNKLNTYALSAEKVLPQKQYKKELEGFVKEGLVSADMKAVLQRAYEKENGSAAGFDDYMNALQTEALAKSLEELKKSMLNEKAPSFALLDLDGNKVASADLKGKTVVVDFWATWCGPCKASFPGMQKMVAKFKDNPDVKFVFVDTWERGDDKKKGAADFITTNKYDFHVLMDDENKVVEQFGVEGIPTKFVIDKEGMIRFKAVGFDGSDDKLISELTAMIEMASAPPAQKAF